MLDFGEVRSWCALKEEAFLRRFPMFLFYLLEMYKESPERYEQEVAPYIAKHWKGIYTIRKWEDWHLFGKYAPFGRYHFNGNLSQFGDIKEIDETLSYEGLEDLGLYLANGNDETERLFEKLCTLVSPRILHMNITKRWFRSGAEFPDFRELLTRVEDFTLVHESNRHWNPEVEGVISKIPVVTLELWDFGKGEYFTDTVWESHSLTLGGCIEPDTFSPTGRFEDLLVQPHIKKLSYLDLEQDVDLRGLREKFPAVTSLALRVLLGIRPRSEIIHLPGGEWECLDLNLHDRMKIAFDSPVHIKHCKAKGRWVFESDFEIKVDTMEAHYPFEGRDQNLDIEHYILARVEDPSLLPSSITKCTLTLCFQDLDVLMELCKRFGDNFTILE